VSIDIDFDDTTDEWIEVYFQFAHGPRLQVDAAGTSVLQASQILAYIALFQPQVLILDEPDSHLHPDNQRALCRLVFRLATERGFQALISTHSRHVLDCAKGQGSVVWLSKGAKVNEPDLNTTAMLLDLGALDSMDYFADGHTRCVVATEDADKDLLHALLWSNGFIEEDTEVVSYTGCSKIDAALVLGRFLESKAPNVCLVVHRDRDYMDVQRAQDFCDTLVKASVHPFLTDHSDIEGYFINADHLHTLNPSISLEQIRHFIGQAVADVDQGSLEAMINLRTEEAFRLRNKGGGSPNHGLIASEARADLTANSVGLTRGKLALGRLQSLLQKEVGTNPRIFFPSGHLQVPALRSIADEIWPKPGT